MSTVKTNNVQIGQSATATNNFTWYQPASPDGTVRLGNGNAGAVTDRVTVTSAGNVGIGTSSPSAKLDVNGNIAASTAVETRGAYAYFQSYNTGAGTNLKYWRWLGDTSGALVFETVNDAYTSATERMRIQGNGYFLLNTAATFPGYNSRFSIYWASDAEQGITFKTSSTTFNGQPVQFLNSSNGVSGYIAQSASFVTYATSSDARIKKNIVDAPEAGSLIDAIQVRSWDFKVDGTHWRYGMVAQELLGVAPEAVNVPENPDMMMGVDYSKLVPMLIKELQSVRARLAAVEGAIA